MRRRDEPRLLRRDSRSALEQALLNVGAYASASLVARAKTLAALHLAAPFPSMGPLSTMTRARDLLGLDVFTGHA